MERLVLSMLKMPPGRTSISARDTRPQGLGMYAIFDVAFAGVFALSLLYPLVFVVWVIARSRRLATKEQG